MAAPSGPLDTAIVNLANTVLADFTTRQETYRAGRGRYWQGIRTHAVLPADGALVAPTPAVRPTDQAENWTVFGFALPATMPCALEVNVYQSPSGWGYEVCVMVRTNGGTESWRRAFNVGPEPWRTHGWRRMDRVGL